MAKYQFRLETLQKVREAERDNQRTRLAAAYQADEVLQEQREKLQAQFDQLHQLRRRATDGSELDIAALQAAARYEPVLKSQEQVLIQQRQLLDQEIERRRQELINANRGVRVLEMLDQRRREEHRRDELRAETRQYDETASMRAFQQRQVK